MTISKCDGMYRLLVPARFYDNQLLRDVAVTMKILGCYQGLLFHFAYRSFEVTHYKDVVFYK